MASLNNSIATIEDSLDPTGITYSINEEERLFVVGIDDYLHAFERIEYLETGEDVISCIGVPEDNGEGLYIFDIHPK